MFVPSVMLPKLRLRAGSWKRERPLLLLRKDDMVFENETSRGSDWQIQMIESIRFDAVKSRSE